MKTKSIIGMLALTAALHATFNAAAREMLLGVEFNGKTQWIDPTTGDATQIATGPGGMNSLATDTSGRMFTVAGQKLWEIDPHSGSVSFVANVSADIRALAFSPANVLYGIQQANNDRLVRINMANGAIAVVGATGLTGLQALDFAPDGTLYGIDLGKGLVTINPLNGQTTDVNPNVGDGAQTLAISSSGAAYRGTTSAIYSINLQTGISTLIGGSGFNDLRGLGVFEVPDVPPSGSLADASPTVLWPPNNKAKDVTICGTVTAGSAAIASVTLIVDDEYGVVTGSLDITASVAANGEFCAAVPLIASRAGNDKDGRVYSVTLVVADVNGLTSEPISTFALVPHDMGKGK